MADNRKRKHKKRNGRAVPEKERMKARAEAKAKKTEHIGGLITSGVFLAIVFGFGAAFLFKPARSFSDMENRVLAQTPEFSLESLKKGEFTADIETYMSDQIALKDTLVTLKTDMDRGLGKTYQNGVYFGKNGFYIQDFQTDLKQARRNIGFINEFADALPEDIPVGMILAPTGAYSLYERLPGSVQTMDQGILLDEAENTLSPRISLTTARELRGELSEGYYYRTDHHWTAEGAMVGFEALMEAMGEESPMLDYDTERVPEFYGTLYSKAPSAFAKADTIELRSFEGSGIKTAYTRPNGDHEVPAECREEKGVLVMDGLFAMSQADKKDKYAIFLGGNFARLDITSETGSGEHVLVIKDSYANAMMPYLCEKYREITVLDLRYYHDMDIAQLVEEENVSRVIFIFNADFINEDNNFGYLM